MSTEKWHGTAGGYTNHRCRCVPCTEAWRVEHHRYMHADPERLRKGRDRMRALRARRRAEAAQ